MKTKFVLCVIFAAVLLFLPSCTGGQADVNEDYKKLKDEYAERENEFLRAGFLSTGYTEDDFSFAIDPNECPHQSGYGYVKDAEGHTYICKKCRMAEGESEPHSDVQIFLINMSDGLYIYAKSCPVCASEKAFLGDSNYFEIIATEKDMEEFKTFYGVNLYGEG